MKTHVEQNEMILDLAAALDMDPDILALAAYIAGRRHMTLGEFLEQLITNDRLAFNSAQVGLNQ